MIRVVLLLTVFLLPLIQTTPEFGYEQAKVFLFIVFISLIGFLWFIYLMKNPKFKWSGIIKAAGLFIVILLVTSLIGSDPKTSLLGSYPYFQGWILYAYLFLFFLLVSSAKIKFEHWAYVLSGSAVLVGILAIWQWGQINLWGLQIPNYAGRVVSTFGQPNFYGGFLLLTLPFTYYLLKTTGNKLLLLAWGSGLIASIGIIVSYSRSAILLFLILLTAALFAEIKIKRFLIIIPIIVLGAFLLSINFSSGLWWSEWVKPQDKEWLIHNSPEKRIFIWPVVWQLIKISPVTGYGLENIATVYSQYFINNKRALFEENLLNVKPSFLSLKDLNLDRTHNYILDLLLFSGILGLLGWLGLIILLFKKLVQKPYGPPLARLRGTSPSKNVLIVCLVTYLIWIQFQNQSIVHLVYFWWLAGVIDKN